MAFSLVPEHETLAWKAVGQQGVFANPAARTTLLVVGGALVCCPHRPNPDSVAIHARPDHGADAGRVTGGRLAGHTL